MSRTLQVLLSCYLVVVGLLFCALPWLYPHVAAWLENNFLSMLFLGGAQCFLGYLLLQQTASERETSAELFIQRKSLKITIGEGIVQHYLTAFWEQKCPGSTCLCLIGENGSALFIDVALPGLPWESRERFVEIAREDLSKLLRRYFDYKDPYQLTISFSSTPCTADSPSTKPLLT